VPIVATEDRAGYRKGNFAHASAQSRCGSSKLGKALSRETVSRSAYAALQLRRLERFERDSTIARVVPSHNRARAMPSRPEISRWTKCKGSSPSGSIALKRGFGASLRR
jgi:hypothetical protein